MDPLTKELKKIEKEMDKIITEPIVSEPSKDDAKKEKDHKSD